MQVGVAGMAWAGLADVLRAGESSRLKGEPRRDTAVILLWLDGGPSHMDIYDMKPEAPAEYRGIWSPIRTNVSGIEITELFPLQAKIADKFSIIRSLHHDIGRPLHRRPLDAHRPRRGVSGGEHCRQVPVHRLDRHKRLGCSRKPACRRNVAVPYAMSIGLRPGYFGGHYLGRQYDPFETEGDPNADQFQVQNIALQITLTVDRLDDRRSLAGDTSTSSAARSIAAASFEAMDRFDQQAYEMVTGEQRPQGVRHQARRAASPRPYGRHTWGQSTLLARRLVEAGSHVRHVPLRRLGSSLGSEGRAWRTTCRMVDQLVSGLFTDLEQRGLLDNGAGRAVRRVQPHAADERRRQRRPAGEHGHARPRPLGQRHVLPDGRRRHPGGQIVGSTNRLGEVPQSTAPCVRRHLHHTIYHVFGVDPATNFLDHSGRPMPAIDHGELIAELF